MNQAGDDTKSAYGKMIDATTTHENRHKGDFKNIVSDAVFSYIEGIDNGYTIVACSATFTDQDIKKALFEIEKGILDGINKNITKCESDYDDASDKFHASDEGAGFNVGGQNILLSQ